ncbi:hypothetical protein [Hathewaya massiliensis]|uniref:hypothetical protein n=1 Tax=Hathewaya massiliensis TaxID=1964382 RepID=UPI00115AFA7A|nr:hypothetical protein [Hathewaya massiliensis]
MNENNDEDLKRVKDKLKKEYRKHFDEEITEIFNYSSFNNKKLEGKFAVEKIVDKINEKIRSVKLPEKKQQCLEEMIVFISRYIDENKNELSEDKIDKIKNLENYIKNISVQYKIGYIRELLYKKIDELFSVKNWGAYPLLRQIDIKVCPYCNRQYISIDECEINKSSSKAKEIRGKTRPELDHFLSKSKFPFYSMSLYNLIPSCHVCNSNLKSDVNFIKTNEQDQINKDYIEALNPYEDGFNENYLFSINPNNDKDNNYDFLFENSLAFNIGFKKHVCDSKGAESIDKQLKIIKRAEGNENIFHLESLYNKNHKDIVYELIQIAKIYNEEYLDELLKNYSHIFSSKKDIMRMVLSNYIDEKDLDKRVMGKLVHDIAKQLGLLEYLE